MSKEEFVVGPDLDWDDLDVDPVFGKEFGRARDELLAEVPGSFDEGPSGWMETPSRLVPGIVFRSCVCGVVAFDGDVPVGGMLETDLVLARSWRGRGLGREIVLEAFMREGGFRIWGLDAPAFTPAGLASFEGAWELAGDRRLFETKADDLALALEAAAVRRP